MDKNLTLSFSPKKMYYVIINKIKENLKYPIIIIKKLSFIRFVLLLAFEDDDEYKGKGRFIDYSNFDTYLTADDVDC